ncbi:hypothetical protein Hgul01_00479 [Herpetosiphon gulosus]|uniref:Uncharacterized protein n=1 Tax=Herpetosiphon gulosus TaxID=1973496 RepID=A0ABP9WU32_9CHLR
MTNVRGNCTFEQYAERHLCNNASVWVGFDILFGSLLMCHYLI